MGLLGILLSLTLLMWLAFRGWSVLLAAPTAALVAAGLSGEPLLAHWTQTFMGRTSGFVAKWFPLFLLGGLFGKLMDDSGSISSIARYLTERLGAYTEYFGLYPSGASSALPENYFDGGFTFASKIASAASEFNDQYKAGAYIAAGLVLFILTFVVNSLARAAVAGKDRSAS